MKIIKKQLLNTHSDYMLSLLDEITNEPTLNRTKWWLATAVFTKALAASHLLVFGTAAVENCSLLSHLQC